MYGSNNYYNPTFQQRSPYYPMQDNLAQLRSQQMPMQMPVQSQIQAQPQNNNGLIWVQGESGAKSFLVAPNTTVMLMDSEASVFYLKSADASGMPLPLRIFDYKERQNATTSDFKAPTSNFSDLDDKYITREEFERRMASIAPQTATKKTNNKLTEDAENGEQLV